MRKLFLRMGSALAFFSVAIGALGAHALKTHLSSHALANFETGVKYQFYHALAIVAISVLMHFGRKKSLIIAVWLFLAGTICFSGSLYLLSTKEIHGIDMHWLGPITPLGGILLMAGWAWVFVSSYTHFERNYKDEKNG